MNRQFVSSSRMRSVGWENDILEIEFSDGAIYHYYDVSESEYLSFMNSSSLGSEISRLDKIKRYKRIN
ncbi:KTSC domain-containing protein [Solibacillus sp. FSL K6-1523]|uniref:KTSC domain-containing protein n=1 Tax=Solibacillus sp. FSL K6-1523 TaxID=2921471 RepID=UPI0030FD1182